MKTLHFQMYTYISKQAMYTTFGSLGVRSSPNCRLVYGPGLKATLVALKDIRAGEFLTVLPEDLPLFSPTPYFALPGV